MDIDLDKTSERALELALEAAGSVKRGKNWSCPHPEHEDRNPSGSIYLGSDGNYRLKCHAGSCGRVFSVVDVWAIVTGREGSELMKEQNRDQMQQHEKKQPQKLRPMPFPYQVGGSAIIRGEQYLVEDIYPYYGYDNKPMYKAIRLVGHDGKKTFQQMSRYDDGWVFKRVHELVPVYAWSQWEESETVIIVEGEKAAKALLNLGLPATTSSGGAGKAKMTCWKKIKGKDVILWPDKDEAGEDHMNGVVECIEDLASSITRIDPVEHTPRAMQKDDAFDFIDQRMQFMKEEDVRKEIMALIDKAVIVDSAQAEMDHHFDEIYNGEYRNVDMPWPIITSLSWAIAPGGVTVICGPPGSAKSMFALQMMRHFYAIGERCAYFSLEEKRVMWMKRLFVMEGKDNRFMNPRWCKANSDKAEQIRRAHEQKINRMAKSIFTQDEGRMTGKDLITRTTMLLQSGYRVIMIDPITAIKNGKEIWNEHEDLVDALKKAAEHYNATIVLVHHPSKGDRIRPSLSSMAGGSALQRFTSCAIWIEQVDERFYCYDPYRPNEYPRAVDCNRRIHILKTRYSDGCNMHLGMRFNKDDFSFSEHGVISYNTQ